jgi:hypothetical protein
VAPEKPKDIRVWGTMLEGRVQPVGKMSKAASAARGQASAPARTAVPDEAALTQATAASHGPARAQAQPLIPPPLEKALGGGRNRASVGGVGDSYDNALAECVIGLYKTEVTRRRGPWRNRDAVEYATLEWIGLDPSGVGLHSRLQEPARIEA